MINNQEVEHIASLARLGLSEEEKNQLGEQLSSILDYVGQLKEVDVSGVEYQYQIEELNSVTRLDEVQVIDISIRQALIDAMPEKAGDLLRVKGVFE